MVLRIIFVVPGEEDRNVGMPMLLKSHEIRARDPGQRLQYPVSVALYRYLPILPLLQTKAGNPRKESADTIN